MKKLMIKLLFHVLRLKKLIRYKTQININYSSTFFKLINDLFK